MAAEWRFVIPGASESLLPGPRGAPGEGWQVRCPACETPVVQEGKYWRCPNVYACEPQVVGRTLQMASGIRRTRNSSAKTMTAAPALPTAASS